MRKFKINRKFLDCELSRRSRTVVSSVLLIYTPINYFKNIIEYIFININYILIN